MKEEELDAAVQAQLAEVAALRAADEGVNMVLLAAAQAEMEALRAQAAEQAARAAGLEARWVGKVLCRYPLGVLVRLRAEYGAGGACERPGDQVAGSSPKFF